MKIGLVLGSLLPFGVLAFAVASGCLKKTDDAGVAVDAAVPPPPEVIARGQYLVNSVSGCAECHTPRDDKGNLDKTRWLAGVANRFDLVPGDDTMGGISAPNLTPASLASWTDGEIKAAIVDGRDPDGTALYPLMPYYAYHGMSDDDANAIVAYLRTVPSVDNQVPPRQPLPDPIVTPAEAIADTAIPHTTLGKNDKGYASAERGRYLAAKVGLCMDCHTPWRAGVSQPLDLQNAFAGGRTFSARDWAVPAPAPAVVYSYNVTPDPSGIATWTPEMVVTALLKGTDDLGATLCRPMPSGTMGGLGGLTDSDALDIAMYVTTLPPIATGQVPECSIGGEQDASTDGAIEGAAPDSSTPDSSVPDSTAPDASTPDAAGNDSAADALSE